jgi:CBS domain-containing protein
MQMLYILGFALFTTMLVMVASIAPRRSGLSTFELERRKKEGSESAADELRREVLLEDILSVRHAAEALLLVLVAAASLAAFDMWLGLIAALAVALFYGRLAQYELVQTWVSRLYEHHEATLLGFVEHHPHLGRILKTVAAPHDDTRICSRQELEHLVEQSGAILTGDEKRHIINGLHFNEKTVEQIMTPRGVVDTIAKSELIGPLTLNDLHKTGHSRFPVIDGDIDHVIGVLHIKDLLTLGKKDSETAEQAMEKKVFYIHQEQTLQHALAAFIKTRHHLFIVVNGYRETAGILTLEDCIEALLGREIVDEYDLHDDLRAVAERNAKSNNNPSQGTNV